MFWLKTGPAMAGLAGLDATALSYHPGGLSQEETYVSNLSLMYIATSFAASVAIFQLETPPVTEKSIFFSCLKCSILHY